MTHGPLRESHPIMSTNCHRVTHLDTVSPGEWASSPAVYHSQINLFPYFLIAGYVKSDRVILLKLVRIHVLICGDNFMWTLNQLYTVEIVNSLYLYLKHVVHNISASVAL